MSFAELFSAVNAVELSKQRWAVRVTEQLPDCSRGSLG